MSSYPRVLKNMNLFVDGRGYAGHVDEITLPTLALATEEHRAGGMDIPVELDMGMEAMEVAAVLSDFQEEAFAYFGALELGGVPITVRGAMQAQGSAAVTSVVVNMIGGWKGIDPGNWKPGEKSTLSLTGAVSYFRLEINGVEYVEIDALNMVRRIGGVDQLALQRAAIGI